MECSSQEKEAGQGSPGQGYSSKASMSLVAPACSGVEQGQSEKRCRQEDPRQVLGLLPRAEMKQSLLYRYYDLNSSCRVAVQRAEVLLGESENSGSHPRFSGNHRQDAWVVFSRRQVPFSQTLPSPWVGVWTDAAGECEHVQVRDWKQQMSAEAACCTPALPGSCLARELFHIMHLPICHKDP